jgi:hypothetical protein
VRQKEPKWLAGKLMEVYYEEKRKPGLDLFFDGSKRKKGRQSIENRLLIHEIHLSALESKFHNVRR